MSLVMMKALNQVRGLTVGELTVEKLDKLATTFGQTLNKKKAEELLELAKQDSAQAIEDWIFNDDNYEKVTGVLQAESAPLDPALCPHCNEMSIIHPDEIPAINPHVLCKHCNGLIKL
jgi:hypothetical protein